MFLNVKGDCDFFSFTLSEKDFKDFQDKKIDFHTMIQDFENHDFILDFERDTIDYYYNANMDFIPRPCSDGCLCVDSEGDSLEECDYDPDDLDNQEEELLHEMQENIEWKIKQVGKKNEFQAHVKINDIDKFKFEYEKSN